MGNFVDKLVDFTATIGTVVDCPTSTMTEPDLTAFTGIVLSLPIMDRINPENC